MPSRILKESICTSDSLDKLTAFQENVFYRLIVNCDDFGRMDARPRILASRLYPLREDIRVKQLMDALQALSSAELVILYQVDGKPFLQMRTWERHQQIRAKKSKYPAPENQPQKQMPKSDINCNQPKSDDYKCPRNPIQSNPIEVVTRTREDDGDDLMQIARKNDLVYQAADGIGLSGSTALQHADRLIADYSPEWVLEAIQRTSRAAKDAWSWRYIEGILQRWKKAGSIDTEAPTAKPAKIRKETYTYVINGEEKTFEREVPA